MERDASTYRGARRNANRSKRAAKLKALRLAHRMTRSELDFTRHLHPASYRVLQLAAGS